MARQRHTSLTLRNQIAGLNATLASGGANDAGVLAQLPSQLGHLRGHLDREKMTEWVPVCTVAVRLAEALSEGRTYGPDELFGLIDSIVAEISRAAGIERAGASDESLTRTPTAVQPGLKLLSSRKLGEIMVQMSMLSPEQVDRALQFQRARGCRLGEALIDLGMLDKEAVLAALKVQDMRGNDLRKAWNIAM